MNCLFPDVNLCLIVVFAQNKAKELAVNLFNIEDAFVTVRDIKCVNKGFRFMQINS